MKDYSLLLTAFFFLASVTACSNPLGGVPSADSYFNPGAADTTPPTSVGVLNITSNNAANDRSVTVDWSASPSTDDQGPVQYELAIGFDEDGDGFDTGDLDNLTGWQLVPDAAGNDFYQVIDGIDGFDFTSRFNEVHYVSIRATDSSNNKSTVTSSIGWKTYDLKHQAGLSQWLDSADSQTIFESESCTGIGVANGDPVGCWLDKSPMNKNATAVGLNRPIYSSSMAVVFQGEAAPNSEGECFEMPPVDVGSFFVVIESAQTAQGGIHGLYGSADPARYIFLSTAQNYTISFDGAGNDQGRIALNGGLFSNYGENIGANNLTSNLQIVSGETQTVTSGWKNLGCFNHASGAKNYRANYDIKEILSFSLKLSQAERTRVEGHLACKWNLRDQLPVDHLYFALDGNSKVDCP